MGGGFYILSLKWLCGDLLVWWRADNKGYTTRLDDAGVYTAEQIASHPDYYNDGQDTLAVPCADVWAESARFVLNDSAIINRFRAGREAMAERSVR